MILMLVVALIFVSPAIYFWERNRDHGENRFEAAIARRQRELARLGEPALVERVRTHPYLTGTIRDSQPVKLLLEYVDDKRYKSIVDDWERVARWLVEAERQAGRSGTPELICHETELTALLRALDTVARV